MLKSRPYIISENAWSIPLSADNSVTEIASYLGYVELDGSRHDEVLWTVGNTGLFTMKSTYEAIRHRNRKVDWEPLVWFKGNIPKHSFITWVLLHGALKTLSTLKKWGLTQSDTCTLCNQDSETDKHLFFYCTYSKLVWENILQYLNYSRQVSGWEEELQWCSQHFAGHSNTAKLKKIALNATVYAIWNERNKRLYEQQVCPGSELVKRIYTDIRLKLNVEELIAEDGAQSRQLFNKWNLDAKYMLTRPIKCKWKRPNAGWYKVNSDGSLQGARGGYGAVIRDDTGVVVAACSGATNGHTVIKHELQGIEAGVKLARLYNLMKLDISTDSTTVLEYLTKDMNTTWNLRHIIRRIKRMLGQLDQYNVSHDYRETNRIADKLASLLLNYEFIEIISSSFAEDLKNTVHEDKIGKTYLRL